MRRLIPYGYFLGFVTLHFFLVWSQVPLKNQIPATLGAAAFTAMSLCFVFAARNSRIDALTGGPGRSYRIHRWLGYWAFVTLIGHWMLAQPHGEGYLPHLASLAGQSGEYAAIALILLICMAVLEIIPYHIWKLSHYLMGPIYLVIVFHVFFAAVPVAPWGLLWWILLFITLMGLGGLASTVINHLMSAARYQVKSITHARDTLDIRLVPEDGNHPTQWSPGQFATIYSDRDGLREPHPLTISSSPQNPELRFLVGTGGDYTSRLSNQLKVGDTIHLQSIRGEFSPDVSPTRRLRQIWVAGGTGISPFLAAIDAMQPDEGPQIDLFYCYRSLGHVADIESMVAHAKRLPQLVIHFLGERDGATFTDTTFPSLLSEDWPQAELYVCGPKQLSDIACSSYRAHGGLHRIQAEIFEFRPGITIFQKKAPGRMRETDHPHHTGSRRFGIMTFGRK